MGMDGQSQDMASKNAASSSCSFCWASSVPGGFGMPSTQAGPCRERADLHRMIERYCITMAVPSECPTRWGNSIPTPR